jgi:hypothetical protein
VQGRHGLCLVEAEHPWMRAFYGRTPKSILARHYIDYSPEKLKEIYEKAHLNVLT